MNLHSIPPHLPFLDELASWWLRRAGAEPEAVASGLILLPTRRSARALSDAFLRASGGRALLLPRIAALGAQDEAALALSGALDLLPAVPEATRLAVLTRLVMQLEGRHGAPGTADRAWPLAVELASLLDEAHRAEIDLAQVLPAAAAIEHAAHWDRTVRFLAIVTEAWPAWLRDNGLMDAAARSRALLDAQSQAWEAAAPGHPIVIAGTTGGVPAVARLMRVVARLPQGTIVLPGVDHGMADAVWDALDDGHPQAGLRRLLHRLAATRGDVTPWPEAGAAVPPGRDATIRRALLPAQALGDWRLPFEPALEGVSRLEPADQQEEAVAIALVLRDALEAPHARAALVTPDRALAVRVGAELARFGIVADDSAGERLADTPPGIFLRLLARSVAEGFAPVSLLAVLKHPLAGFGLSPAACRQAARALELACLRGPAPAPGLDGLRAAAARTGGVADVLDRLDRCFAPLLAIGDDPLPVEALGALIATAEAAASTDESEGAARLWSREEGDALAQHLTALLEALPVLPAQPAGTLPGLLEASMAGAVVRTRRALRGRSGDREHPRVQILGLLEARLQTADVLVLGGLVESIWPPGTDPGPWMSRPMRLAAGLPSPEEGVGQMAHDFAMLVSAAPRVVLSCPRRRDGAPAVPARWLVRIEAFLAGFGTALPAHPAASWARALDQPAGPPQPVQPPAPKPPVHARPRSLRVTEIETWLRDPYAIHARHVLRLRALDPLEQSADASDYGSLVHAGIAAFLAALPPTFPPDAKPRLRAEMARALEASGVRPALAAWWRPRLMRIADWVAEAELGRRQQHQVTLIRSEIAGEWAVPAGALPFTLRGRADRIERHPEGGVAILDYKTGLIPNRATAAQGLAPQLLLEAAMTAAGVFGEDVRGDVTELTYWHLTGGFVPGEVKPLFGADAAEHGAEAARQLVALIHAYDDPARAYLSQPHPGAAPRFSDYAQLARVLEWAALEEGS